MASDTPTPGHSTFSIALVALVALVAGAAISRWWLCPGPGHQQGPITFRRARFVNAAPNKVVQSATVAPRQDGAPLPMPPIPLTTPTPSVPPQGSNSADADTNGFSVGGMLTTNVVEVTLHVVLTAGTQPTDVTVTLPQNSVTLGNRIDEVVFTLLANNTIQANVYYETDTDHAMKRFP